MRLHPVQSSEHADMSFNEYRLSSTLRQASSQLQVSVYVRALAASSWCHHALLQARSAQLYMHVCIFVLTTTSGAMVLPAGVHQRAGGCGHQHCGVGAQSQAAANRPTAGKSQQHADASSKHQQVATLPRTQGPNKAPCHHTHELHRYTTTTSPASLDAFSFSFTVADVGCRLHSCRLRFKLRWWTRSTRSTHAHS